jgi:SAM-dependent methyltransferase
MTTGVFGPAYAQAYDALYEDKDYGRECDLLEQVFRRFGGGLTRSVLDLGCGTGSHAIELARRGYDVVGVDRSLAMLGQARAKAEHAGVRVEFRASDLREFREQRRFDAASMMFAVLGYQHENSDVLAALRAARAQLRAGGLLVFDAWYGPAVLVQRPGDRWKLLENGTARVLRAASGRLDVLRQCCDVSYRVWHFEGTRVTAEAAEQHRMRFFFPEELRLLLDQTGFRLRSLSAFPELDRAPDDSTWSVFAVASAVCDRATP